MVLYSKSNKWLNRKSTELEEVFILKCLSFLAIKDMQIKKNMLFYLTQIRMSKINQSIHNFFLHDLTQ